MKLTVSWKNHLGGQILYLMLLKISGFLYAIMARGSFFTVFPGLHNVVLLIFSLFYITDMKGHTLCRHLLKMVLTSNGTVTQSPAKFSIIVVINFKSVSSSWHWMAIGYSNNCPRAPSLIQHMLCLDQIGIDCCNICQFRGTFVSIKAASYNK